MWTGARRRSAGRLSVRVSPSQCCTMACVCVEGGLSDPGMPVSVRERECVRACVEWTLPWTAVGLRRRSAAAPTRSPASPLRPCDRQRVSEIGQQWWKSLENIPLVRRFQRAGSCANEISSLS